MSLKGIHLIHSFAYFSPSQPHQIFRLLYIYMYIYTMPSIAQYLSICCVYSLELYSWHLTACITSSCPSSHCHHLLRPFCIVALIIYEMLHSLPTHHHCISLHQLLAICSVSLSSRLVLFEYWCSDESEHSSEILSASWVQIRSVPEVVLASWWNECGFGAKDPRKLEEGTPFGGKP